jgi:hypothetical protein
MEKYLGPICEILAYSLYDHEFQLVVHLKPRYVFEYHFKDKNKDFDVSKFGIPETTYIFSQAMANLQVSFVKHFNWLFKRTGALVAGRFRRNLIENREEL